MNITVNVLLVQIEKSMTVDQVLDNVDVPPNYLAVELNGEVVPREEYTRCVVNEGDNLEVVTLVGGG